jgi:RNA polymerase sigma-70 factor (ECF subfamily)
MRESVRDANGMAATDQELIDRARRGDVGSYAHLAARWDEKAYALAYRLLQDVDSAEDVKQTAFLRAFERLGQFDGRAALSTWFYRIVVNLCRDQQRSSTVQRRVQRGSRAGEDGQRSAAPDAPVARARAETAQRVAAAVRALPLKVREVVVTRHYLDLKFADIAGILDVPVSTVKSRMVQGLRLLRETLEDEQS